MRYFLGPWVWHDSKEFPHWSAPDGCEPALDLRTLPQTSLAEKVEGFGLFTAPDHVNPGSEWTDLGTDPEAILPERTKRVLEGALGLNLLAANRLHDILWEQLTIQSDPTGEDCCKPIVPTVQRFYELWLSGSRVRSFRWNGNEPEAAPVLDMLRREYRENRAAVHDQKLPPDHHLKVLDYWCEKYRLDHRAFIPADLPDEGRKPHETTVLDDFNRANETTLTGWTHSGTLYGVNSNVCYRPSSGNAEQATNNTALSSSDNYSQIDQLATVSSSQYVAPTARRPATSAVNYICYITLSRAASSGLYYRNALGGAGFTLLASFSDAPAAATLKTSANGSTIKSYRAGSEVASVTDTTLSSGVYCGIVIRDQSSGGADNFEAGDLAAAGQPTAKRWGGIPSIAGAQWGVW